jgi:hypothetical protein
VALLVQVPEGRNDLLGTYGVVPALIAMVAAVAWTFADKLILPAAAQRTAMLASALAGAASAAWAIKSFAAMTF